MHTGLGWVHYENSIPPNLFYLYQLVLYGGTRILGFKHISKLIEYNMAKV